MALDLVAGRASLEVRALSRTAERGPYERALVANRSGS